MAGETFAYFLWEDPNTAALPLPVEATDRIAVARGPVGSEATYYATLPIASNPAYSYVVPTAASTQTATEGLGAFVFEPAGVLATLAVVMPPSPIDGQLFGISTTINITLMTVTAPAGATVAGGAATILAANTAKNWRYVAAQSKWYAA